MPIISLIDVFGLSDKVVVMLTVIFITLDGRLGNKTKSVKKWTSWPAQEKLNNVKSAI